MMMKKMQVVQKVLISRFSELMDLMLYLLMVKVIVLKVFSGVSFMIRLKVVNSMWEKVWMLISIVCLILLMCVRLKLYRQVSSSIGSILFFEKVLKKEFGMMCSMNLVKFFGGILFVYLVMMLVLRCVGFMCMFVLGCSVMIVIRLVSSVMIVSVQNRFIVLSKVLLMFFVLFSEVMLLMIV